MNARTAKESQSAKASSSAAKADPIIWLAVDSGMQTLAEMPEPDNSMPKPVFGQIDADFDVRALATWFQLARNGTMPCTDLSLSGRLANFAEHGMDIHVCPENGQQRLKIRQIGHALGQKLGRISSLKLDTYFDPSNVSLFDQLAGPLAELFAGQEPVCFNVVLDELRLPGILMPFGEGRIESILAVFGEANYSAKAGGLSLPDAEDELILELDEELAVEPQQRDDETITTGQRSKMVLKKRQESSVTDLIAEAQNSAEDAREAEERSRLALYAALSRSYDIALRAAQEPEKFAAQLVFGAHGSDSQLADFVSVLQQARDIDLGEGELADYLKSQDEGITSLLEASRETDQSEAA